MSSSALCASFEYLYYGSTAIINIFNSFSAGTYFRRQNLTYKDGLRRWPNINTALPQRIVFAALLSDKLCII